MQRPNVNRQLELRGPGIRIAIGDGAMITKLFSWAAILAMGLQLGGCIQDYGPVTTDSVPVSPYAVASTLQTGDELKIIIFGEDALSGIYDISPAGTISMPLIGTVRAAGRTRAEVEHEITQALCQRKIPARAEDHGFCYWVSAVLHFWRSRNAWQICLYERSRRADRRRDGGGLHLSRQ